MEMTDEVLNDLLTLYLAGEASADTRALIENHARQNAAFASRLAATGGVASIRMPSGGLPGDLELRALKETRRFIFVRTMFVAGGILFTLLPLVFSFDSRGVEFLVLGRHAGLMWSFWSVAAASWTGAYVVHRKVRPVGL